MTNTQKAELRRIARAITALKTDAETVLQDLDSYIDEHNDTLDGTERGEKLDGELDALSFLQDTFDTLVEEINEITD